MGSEYEDIILIKANEYAHKIYKLSVKVPKEEIYGFTSQLRRAALSVPLNMIEGYARQSAKSQAQFLKISYGSLKESIYLLNFGIEEKLLSKDESKAALSIGDELGRLIWKKSQTLSVKK